jgi:hypothetical protein
MKPTQEQIHAALRYEDGNEDGDDLIILDELRYKSEDWEQVSFRILAAAYRELQKENKQLKALADLAISSNALLEIERLKKS